MVAVGPSVWLKLVGSTDDRLLSGSDPCAHGSGGFAPGQLLSAAGDTLRPRASGVSPWQAWRAHPTPGKPEFPVSRMPNPQSGVGASWSF